MDSPCSGMTLQESAGPRARVGSSLWTFALRRRQPPFSTFMVIPGVGHSISFSTPGYWEGLSRWLDHLYADGDIQQRP